MDRMGGTEVLACLYGVEVGILLVDPLDRSVVWANRAMRDLLGSDQEITRFTLDIPAELMVSPRLERHSSMIGGKEFGYSVYPAPPLKLVLCRDISEPARRERIAETLEATALLGRAFLSFRHEIGNPLNSVKSALTVLSDNWDRLPKELISDFLKRSVEEIRRIERFLSHLGWFVTSETLTLQDLDVNELLQDVSAEILRVFAAVPRLRFEMRRDPKGSRIQADASALSRCILALTQNALEAVSGKDAPKVELRAYAAAGQVRIEVWDNGPGVAPEIRGALFRPFVTTKAQGLGLGLAVTRKTLAEMQAAISLSSDRGGTTATIAFSQPETAP